MSSFVITIHTDKSSPRLKYVLDWLIKERLNANWQYKNGTLPSKLTIQYGGVRDQINDIYISQVPLLLESTIHEQTIEVSYDHEEHPYFYKADDLRTNDTYWGFDLLSCIFYLLSRYEEYLPYKRDQHGRYPYSASLAHRANSLSFPLIDYWVEKLRKQIEKASGESLFVPHNYQLLPTIDIDMLYAYKHKAAKQWLAFVRDALYLRKQRLGYRITAIRSGKDPFDTFDYLVAHLPARSIFFFLMHHQLPFDDNDLYNHTDFASAIKSINQRYRIGLHPSYSSHESVEQLRTELTKIEYITNSKVNVSRQHYLKFDMPTTYQRLLAIGIHEDHSMMYPDQSGFRASTCHPFYWYDLSAETQTPLRIYSPCTMDVTLKDYEGLSPAGAKHRINGLKSVVKKYAGSFSFIWHNSSFSAIHGWSGWQDVFEHMVDED